MVTIRELFEIVLLLAKVVLAALQGAPDFRSLERQIFEGCQAAARRLVELVCERLDERLAEGRDKRRLRLIHRRKSRVLVTWFGEVRLERRYYQDLETGKGRYLLDEALGLEPRERLSPLVQEQAVNLALDLPYHRAATQLEALTLGAVSASAMKVWAATQAAGAAARAQAETRQRAVFDDGEVPPGEGCPEALYVEADEVSVPARGPRGQRKRLELKLAVGYEGKREVGADRRQLVNRRVHAGVMDAETFFEQVVADFGQQWAWDALRRCHFGADGAQWAKQGLEYLPDAVFRLDEYHWRKALRRGLGHDPIGYREVATAIAEGRSWSETQPLLAAAARRCRGRRRQGVRELERYLANHWDGIRMDDRARSLGAIEGQVFHVVARRMKRHGARWSTCGADHLGRLLAARANGELAAFTRRSGSRPLETLPSVVADIDLREPTRAELNEAEDWLRARVPALYGPHADRPWVKHKLRRLAHVDVA
ncbi:MAG: ISLre2 family transposase [Actinobacteria bacterium]|nr:MAG: ISLre2 family transposase [Actinomycetota bacterium]